MNKFYKQVEVSRHPTFDDTDVENLGTWLVDGDTDILLDHFGKGPGFTVCFDSILDIEVVDDRILGEKPGLLEPRGKAWRIA